MTIQKHAVVIAGCRSVGMDDHLSKPVDAQRLFDALERHVGALLGANPADLTQGLARLRGDRSLLHKLIRQFLDVAPPTRDAIRNAVARKDAVALRFAAHRFRGQAATFDAHPVVSALLTLEAVADTGDWARARHCVEAVDKEVSRLTSDLQTHLA
jgi:HPt (histidine-containing phosphotransfer) domain-containing protein